MSQRKRNLKQAFIVTVAAVATATSAAACGNAGFSFDDDEEVITNPPFPCDGCENDCPDEEPAEGAGCLGSAGLTCYYGDVCDQGETIATCEGGTWKLDTFVGGCNPPPPECPSEQPTVGTSCELDPEVGGYPSYCHYPVETPCGVSDMILDCQSDPNIGDVVWVVQQAPESCELPEEQCQLYGDATSCAADEACQWLVPGCTDGGNEVPTGCYAATDCATEGCGEWGECFAGVHDPCHDSLCNACAAEIDVCIPLDTTTEP